MHGHTPPELIEVVDAPTGRTQPTAETLRALLARHRMFLMVVLLPTLVASLYFGLIASSQYISEAHFLVRAAGSGQPTASSLSQMLGIGANLSPAQAESQALGDYLTSHDAVAALEKRLSLTRLFQRPGTDFFSRLRNEPTPETLHKFYTRQVDVDYSSETGITTLKVRAFQPGDALRIATALIEIGEARVNLLNKRAYDDALRVARMQLAEAERELSMIQAQLTRFRQAGRNIDPIRTSGAQIELVTRLRGELATARAQLAGMANAVSPSAPQLRAMEARVAALAAQVAREDSRMTDGSRALAVGLGEYEQLQLRQEFAAKRYSAAAAALEAASEQAGRQQLFVVRVVEPNLPVKSLYPRRLWIVASIFVGLLLIYGIGWLIAAGVREHAA